MSSAGILGLVVAVAVGCAFLVVRRRRLMQVKRMKPIVGCLIGGNAFILVAAGALLFMGDPLAAREPQPPSNVEAQQEVRDEGPQAQPADEAGTDGRNLAAALAVGLATIGAGIAVALTGSAAIGSITQNPDMFGRSLVFVGLAEGIAIYGLIVAFMILTGAFGG